MRLFSVRGCSMVFLKGCAALTLVACMGAHAQVRASERWKETRNVIYTPPKGKGFTTLQPGQSLKAAAHLSQTGYPTRKLLRVVGKVDLPARGEDNFRMFEYRIDDSLDASVVAKEPHSLYFKGEGESFERHAYQRLPGALFRAGEAKAVLPVVRRNALRVGPNGDFGMELQIYRKKVGRNVNDVYDTPDAIVRVAVPEGSAEAYETVEQTFEVPEDVACILVRVGGSSFSGECWLESPRLCQEGKPVRAIPFRPFAERDDTFNYWVGSNLSTRNWPRWRIKVNGTQIFEGNVFDRASDIADFHIPLPETVAEGDEIEVQLLKEERRPAFSYSIRSVEILEESMRAFEVVSVPKFVAKGARFGALVETNRRDVALEVRASGNTEETFRRIVFKEPGLHAVELRAGAPGGRIDLSFSDGTRCVEAAVEQVIDKTQAPIYISSGDDIYLDRQRPLYDFFFKWYISQRVGNFYQFRPSYQWSGVREANDAEVRHYAELLERLRMPYAWQVEGRTMAAPGDRLNPSLEPLSTDLFMGKQAHENDGGYYYWRHFKYQGLYSDMAARTRPYGGIFAKHRPIFTDHGTYIHYDPWGVTDMADGARKFVDNLRYSKGESTRHTGPSTLFRYLYQAGYEWLGAEQMYGPEETILSSLRGASRAYGRTVYGTHHALQWGSRPFTDPKHALRFYLSLAVAYMHGSSHLNTEEALWTDEYVNDHYSESGKAHMEAQHRMFDYLETHTRRGTLTSRVAVIQGRNDAWKSFIRGPLWSQERPGWEFNKACESFDLLRVFYPGNRLDAYSADGWFTSTPYGTVDLLPIEAPLKVMDGYRALVFLGWNTYDAGDFARIKAFVHEGGTVLLSAAHLNAELRPDKPVRFPEDDGPLRELLGEDYRTQTGKQVRSYGRGKVIYFAAPAYPAEDSLRAAYEATLRELAAQSIAGEEAKGWVKASEGVGFTAWDQGDRRTLYVLNIDWKGTAESRPAQLALGARTFEIPVRRWQLETVHCFRGVAVYGQANTTDILSAEAVPSGWKVVVQTTGDDTITALDARSGAVLKKRLPGPGLHTVTLGD